MKTFADYGITVPSDAPEEYVTTCPQCSSSRKKKKARCLSVNTEKGVAYCHHCDWRMSTASGIEAKSTPRKTAKPWVPPTPTLTPLTEAQLDWFADRGITTTTLAAYGVFGGNAYFHELEDEAEAIRFPYRWNGTLWSIKSRTMDKKFTRTPAARKILFGMDVVPSEAESLVWVEGEADVLACYEAGIKNVVSVPDGAPAENAKEVRMEYLEECQEFIAKFKKHVIATDNDGPGRKLEQELSRRLGVDNCKRVSWPEDCKDANDVLVQRGENQIRECIETAREYPVAGLYSVRDIMEEMYDDFTRGELPGKYVGFPNMQPMYSMREGELTIITGYAGSGKSSFASHLAINMAREHSWGFAVFPAEALPLQRFANSLIETYLGKPLRAGIDGRPTLREYTDGAAFIGKHFHFILPSDDEFTVDGILAKARTAVLRYGVRCICIDPWTEIGHNFAEKGQSQTDYIGMQLTKVRNFARNNAVHFIIVAHPRGQSPNTKTGQLDRPNAYSISGSANWANKSDNILVINRPDKEKNTVEVFAEKIRFRIIGRAGLSAYMDFNRLNGRFSPATGGG